MAMTPQSAELISPGGERDGVPQDDGRFKHMNVPPEAELTKACTMAIITGGHLMIEVGASSLDIVDEHGEVARAPAPMSTTEVVTNLEDSPPPFRCPATR